MAIVTIRLHGVPKSWSNSSPWSRRAIISENSQKREWTDAMVLWGRIKRTEAGWEIANPTDRLRIVYIHQRRHGILDTDNLYASIKPILDGCKTKLTRRRKQIQGAGLIWDDRPEYCQIQVTQERVNYNTPCSTVITIERFDDQQANS